MLRQLWRKLARALGRGAGGGPGPEATPAPEPVREPGRTPHTETEAILGLDFGTSCTKVVIRTPFIGGGQSFAVPFDGLVGSGSPFLLPTGLQVDPDGSTRLAATLASPEGWAHSLKLRLFIDPSDQDAAAKVACYLSLVIRKARDWFLTFQRRNLPGHRFRWLVNMGIPSPGYEDDHIREAFRLVAEVAWNLSQGAKPVQRSKAMELLDKRDAPVADIPLGVVPEIIAEVGAYARSRYRNDGLHVIFDAGATTVDICGFRIDAKEGEDRYGLLTTLVEPLGVHQLHLRRMERIRELGLIDQVDNGVRTLELGDPLAVIPEQVGSYLRRGTMSRDDVEIADTAFRKECWRAILKVTHTVRSKRDRWAPQWREGLPVFLCGGGGGMALYRQAVEGVSEFSRNSYVDVAQFQKIPLPNILSFANERIPDRIAPRLAVAYGLSLDEFDLGSIDPSTLIPDLLPMTVREPVPMITKEYV
jgi:hypothetical protein